MHIEEKIVGEVAVLALRGALLFDEDDRALQDKINNLRVDGINKVILDLGKVHRINSVGLGAILAAARVAQKNGGDVRLAEIDREIHDIFWQTRLVQVFHTYETVGRAIASFQSTGADRDPVRRLGDDGAAARPRTYPVRRSAE
jgi:anti-sigma B factor antagonist